ncbi:hypothetical protein GCM10010914_22590 [Deinococcus wulumuqiensis]|uniref:Uncharacterized protein n=1 Tax=Deinococcus wulumuqiensis TaxID=980427 RepID=A0AAV4K7A1_9DEIO|nr:hypothetical protein GCM10010914_22590 [Deinococcus wulumuqiensis]GGP30542.1 hypothetical protein GCM10008021_21930 [Deinococcus wulumuqiensis]
MVTIVSLATTPHAIPIAPNLGTIKATEIRLHIAAAAIILLNVLSIWFGIIHCKPKSWLIAIIGKLKIRIWNSGTAEINWSPNMNLIIIGAEKKPNIAARVETPTIMTKVLRNNACAAEKS